MTESSTPPEDDTNSFLDQWTEHIYAVLNDDKDVLSYRQIALLQDTVGLIGHIDATRGKPSPEPRIRDNLVEVMSLFDAVPKDQLPPNMRTISGRLRDVIRMSAVVGVTSDSGRSLSHGKLVSGEIY